MKREIEIILLSSEFGCGKRGASLGPEAVMLEDFQRKGTFFQNNLLKNLKADNSSLIFESEHRWAKNIDKIVEFAGETINLIENCLEEKRFPLIISGDHSNAIGTISAIKNTFYENKLGIIWIDAHADLHSPYTSPSGNIHGMTLGALLGDVYCSEKINNVSNDTILHWDKLLKLGNKNIHPKVLPEDLVFIDIRDLENAEWTDIRDNKIKYFSPKDIKEKSIENVAYETLEYLEKCDLIYLSFDVDSMDPEISKGTGTPSPNGLSLYNAKQLMKILTKSPKIVAIEFTEINPIADIENKMAKAVLKIIDDIF